MKIEQTENKLQIGDNEVYSKRLTLSVLENDKINIQMAISCDESFESHLVSKQLTLEQFEALSKFCNDKLTQIKTSRESAIKLLTNPTLSIQKDGVEYCKDWKLQPSLHNYNSYCTFFVNEICLFIGLSFECFGLNNSGTIPKPNNQLFNDFLDKLSYLISYTVLTKQHDKFMQIIQSVHDIIPFDGLYLENNDDLETIGSWNINHNCFEFSKDLAKDLDVYSFFKRIENMYKLNNIDNDLKYVIHQRIPSLDQVLKNETELKKLLFGNPETNFIKIG